MTHRPIKLFGQRKPNLSRMDRTFTLRVEPMAPARTQTSAGFPRVNDACETKHFVTFEPPRMGLAAADRRLSPTSLPAAGEWSHPHGIHRCGSSQVRTRRRLCDRDPSRHGWSASPLTPERSSSDRCPLARVRRVRAGRQRLLASLASSPCRRTSTNFLRSGARLNTSRADGSGPDVRPRHEGRNTHGHRACPDPAGLDPRRGHLHLRLVRAVPGLPSAGHRPGLGLCQTRTPRGGVAARGSIDLRSHSPR